MEVIDCQQSQLRVGIPLAVLFSPVKFGSILLEIFRDASHFQETTILSGANQFHHPQRLNYQFLDLTFLLSALEGACTMCYLAGKRVRPKLSRRDLLSSSILIHSTNIQTSRIPMPILDDIIGKLQASSAEVYNSAIMDRLFSEI